MYACGGMLNPYFYRMYFEENISLKPYNTFGIDHTARWFAKFDTINQLAEQLAYIQQQKKSLLILGGGSNILFTKNVEGYVLKNELLGIELIVENDTHYFVKAAAGENWHQFVTWCVAQNYAGLENLSLIPGNCGAGPMQNIGAYGVELKDVFYELSAWDTEDKKLVQFNHADCEFGYRESIFKHRYRGRFVICSVTFQLRKNPVFNTSYGAIQQELDRMGVVDMSISHIAKAVIQIRSSKLPNPAIIGNAGSFFKNPELSAELSTILFEQYPNIPRYSLPEGRYKIPAGWLIEHAGPNEKQSWKGYRKDDAGCHPLQALVLVNYGNATGKEIFLLSEAILQSVYKKYGIKLEREVNML